MRSEQKVTGTVSCLSFVGWLLITGLLVGCNTRYPGPVHGLSFDGTIQSIDLQNRHLTVAPLRPSAPSVVFGWESTTKFWKNGVPIHADAVQAGRNVRIHYHRESGRPVAHHVYMNAPYAGD